MRGSLYGPDDIQVARDFGFTVLTTDELRELGSKRYGELVREKAELTRTRDELLSLLLSGRIRVEDVAA